MAKKKNYIIINTILLLITGLVPENSLFSQNFGFGNTPDNDTSEIKFPIKKQQNYPYEEEPGSPLYLKPSNIEEKVEYDPESNEYIVTKKIGNLNYSTPVTMSIKEYTEYEHEKALREYWQQRSKGQNYDSRSSFIPNLTIGGEAFDKVFGSNTINITPQGSAELIFGFNMSRIDNPSVSEKLRKTPSFTFEERIQMNVTGTIGDKMELGINYNTEATFDFENKTKLEYSGKEDEIIKKIEAGNVTLPLTGSLITGSQSLFGLKTELQFGKLYVTTVFSQQKGETSVIEMEGGAQLSEFEVPVIDYDANRHFFLSQYFRKRYEEALQNLPVINSPVTITKIEVWVTNKTNVTSDIRDILAVTDLAEIRDDIDNTDFRNLTISSGPFPSNDANVIYSNLKNEPNIRDRKSLIDAINNMVSRMNIDSFNLGREYEKLDQARRLKSTDYKLHPNLGYISLNTSLNSDEILAVAYEFTVGGKTYKVGDLSQDYTNPNDVLFVKLLKGTNLSPRYQPTWNLMMKNVYAIGAYQLNPEDFQLDILYQDDKTGTTVPYLKEGKIGNELLLRALDLDRVNTQGDPKPDGLFDYYEGITVYSSNGRIFFPTTQPFGAFLREKITGYKTNSPNKDPDLEKIADKYVFQELYSETQTVARQKAEKNKFIIKGKFKSSSSNEIMLNAMNVPKGSVKVTAGGQQLREGEDYTVDYTLGRVKIINQGLLESGTPIKVSLESHSLFNIQTKTMIGTNLNYRISDNFILGGTILRLNERPLTKKVNIGEEPISNTIWGLNGSYNTESQFLTTMIDKIPLIETKETSSIRIDGEFAQLIPGQSKSIGKNGIAYIDDFEGTETSIEMKTYHSWSLASTPQGQPEIFPEGEATDYSYGYNRAKLAWYTIDPLFLRNISTTPSNIKGNPRLQNSHYTREVLEEEIFPEKDRRRDEPPTLNVLNLAYYPSEVGPYNFVVNDDTSSLRSYDGLNQEDGTLKNPEKRWGGIMREINTNDFEEANVEFIEFWLMDPFVENSDHAGGQLFFNLGDVSEDVLRDSRQSFENGLPASDGSDEVTTTSWARVPNQYDVNKAFDVDPNKRKYQDVGLDGVRNEIEDQFYQNYVDRLRSLNANLVSEIENNGGDFAHDDFHYFRGDDYDAAELDILERYKNYSNPEGNSPTDEQSAEEYPTTGTLRPDAEDINDDNTLNESENYYQYIVDLSPEILNINHPYITNIRQSNETDYDNRTVKWYQFKIPVKEFEQRIGTIDGFNSIRFMRMFLKGWEDPVVLRFAKLELVRSEWRKYELPFGEAMETTTDQRIDTKFDVLSVNIEENTEKEPVSYILPPGIDRAIDPTNPQLQQLNEQSIVLRVTDLGDGDARAAFKTLNMDMRQYTKLKMDVHAEAIPGISLDDYEITAFVRLGSDYKNNFYEYEIPLKVTPPGDYYIDGKEPDNVREIVWPRENFFEIELEKFQEAKQARNDAQRLTGNTDYSSFYKYRVEIDKDGYKDHMITVVGNPSLSDVKVIMIGIRNPGYQGLIDENYNDGASKSFEVWMNELRLTDFRDDGGWAANARVQTRLADLGSLNVAGSILTPGFGSIEKKVNERSKEEIKQYDISTNLQLGKLFPEKAKVSIPMYIGYSEQVINPQYNPLDKDIPLKAALDLYKDDKKAVDSIKFYAQDKTTRKSINFTNVKVNKQSKKPKPWDPANFSVSYSFNEIEKRDVETEYDWEFNHRGSFNYLYNLRPKNIQPLSKVNFLNKKYFKIIRDFNFYYLPSRISYRTDVTRHYNEIKKRNLSYINNPDFKIDATANRNFLWNWYFDLKFDLSRALKFDYSASNMARFDEDVDYLLKEQEGNDSIYNQWKRELWREVQNFGKNTDFNHKLNAQYTVPINKIPFLDWTTLSARYSGTYDWIAGPFTYDANNVLAQHLGNTIKNSNSIQLNSNNNLISLYDKVGYLKRINQQSGQRSGQSTKETKTVNFKATEINLYGGRAKTIEHRLKTEEVKVKVVDENGNEIPVDVNIIDQHKIRITAAQDYKNVSVLIDGEVEKRENPLIFIIENGTRTLMSVRNFSVSYTKNSANTLPGYTPGHEFSSMGINPGWEYALGFNDFGLVKNLALKNNWLTENANQLNSPVIWSVSQNVNVRSNVEPFNGFRIDLNASWNESSNFEEFYFYNDTNPNIRPFHEFLPESRVETGNMSISTITLQTAFGKDADSLNYETFKLYREEIAQRQVSDIRNKYSNFNTDPDDPEYDPGITNDSTGFPNAYGPTSQQVLIPAFFAAYTGIDIEKVKLNPIATIRQMLPNWRITYDGLSKIEFIKKYFRSVNLSHSYRSTYSIASYRRNPFYQENNAGISLARNAQGDYIPEYEISAVSISEQFSPLISVDMNWKNSMTTRFEIKKSRNINLSLTNNQLSEMSSDEMVVGIGYRFKEVPLIINQRPYKSDVNVRSDISVRDNVNLIRSLAVYEKDENPGQNTAGQRVITLKLSADYVLNNNFNLRFFFDRVVNKPYVTNTFPTSNTNVGLSITFNLTQ